MLLRVLPKDCSFKKCMWNWLIKLCQFSAWLDVTMKIERFSMVVNHLDRYLEFLPRGRQGPGGCFTNISRALQNNLSKIHNTRNHIYGENFKLKLCACAQSMALGTRTKYQLEICITSHISAIHKFRENILESSWNVSETTPWVAYRNRSRARKCKSSLTFTSQQNTQSSFNSMYMGNIFCVPFEIPHKNISYPRHHENFSCFTGPKINFLQLFPILNMVI